VLLAPACSSFDQFQDFEHRGRVFKELVQDLAREVEEQVPGAGGQVSGKSPREAVGPGLPPAPSAAAGAKEPAAVEPTVGAVAEATHAPLHQPSSGPAGALTHPPPSRSLELVYVYEVGAEELPPAELEASPQFVDEVPAEAPGSPETLETTGDEPLPFEARQGQEPSRGTETSMPKAGGTGNLPRPVAGPACAGADSKAPEGSPSPTRQSPKKGAPKGAQARPPKVE
jgi:hypothetical protein